MAKIQKASDLQHIKYNIFYSNKQKRLSYGGELNQDFFMNTAEKIKILIVGLRNKGVLIKEEDKILFIINSINIAKTKLKKRSRSGNHKQNIHEFKENISLLTTFPTQLFIELTRNCNSYCTICARSTFKEYFSNKPKYNMPLSLFKKIADKLFPYAKYVDLRGWGESTILTNFLDYVKYALKYKCHFGLVTNLTVRNDMMWEFLIKNNFILGVSFDGARKGTYEKIRTGSNFDDVMHNLKLISGMVKNKRNKDKSVKLMVAVQKHNINELKEIISLAARLAFNRVEFNAVKASDKQEFSLDGVSKNIIAKEVKKAIKLAEKKNIDVQISRSFGIKTFENKLGLKVQERCTRPWSLAYVTHDGGVGPCNCSMSDKFVLGSLKKQNFEDIWNNFNFQLFRRTIHTPQRYVKCNWCYENRFF